MVYEGAAEAAASASTIAAGVAVFGIRISGKSFAALQEILGVLFVLRSSRKSDGI